MRRACIRIAYVNSANTDAATAQAQKKESVSMCTFVLVKQVKSEVKWARTKRNDDEVKIIPVTAFAVHKKARRPHRQEFERELREKNDYIRIAYASAYFSIRQHARVGSIARSLNESSARKKYPYYY